VASAGVSPLRRLTSEQYRNTVRDLLGMKDAKDAVPTTALPGDEAVLDRFLSNVVSPVQGLDVDKYADAAEVLARKAVTTLLGVVPCDPKDGDAACAGKFIESFGKRAYRRPLTPLEIDRLKKVYDAGKEFTNGVRLVIQAILQSPKFLYLVEPVPANGAGKLLALDGWATASRLSYFFLNTMPDDALFTAAEGNQLSTPDQVGKQATRLMADPRFRETLTTFHEQWLELGEVRSAEKDAKLFPAWTPALKAALDEQHKRFVAGVLSEGDGRLETLMTARYSYFSGPLYELYGMKAPAGAAATAWTKVDFNAKERAGLLTHAGLLAGLAHEDRTSFILRGKLIREAVLCTTVPPPPPGVDANETNIPATASARERSEAHRKRPDCASCHQLFDPVGFAFENYDATGRYRTGGEQRQGGGRARRCHRHGKLDGTYANAVELVDKLASADEVRQCFARQWMRFALGREDDTRDDAGSLAVALKALQDSGGKVPDMLVALARSDSFRYQKVRP
jgi:hypothetical protein